MNSYKNNRDVGWFFFTHFYATYLFLCAWYKLNLKTFSLFWYILLCFYLDATSYSICTYRRIGRLIIMCIRKYNSNMNSMKVVIENKFGYLKKKWILKHFNSKFDRVALMIIACYVLHNCEMWGALEPRLANAKTMGDNLTWFGVNKLPIVKEQTRVKD